MADTLTIARPYAEAAFVYAREKGELAEWSDLLATLALIAQEETVRKALMHPEIKESEKVKLFVDTLGDRLPEEGRRLLAVMAEHGRLTLLPEVAKVYESLRAVAENRLVAHGVSALEPTVEQKETIQAALKKKFDADVDVDFSVDPELIAGVRLQIGDWVVDGSARTQLQKLRAAIAQ